MAVLSVVLVAGVSAAILVSANEADRASADISVQQVLSELAGQRAELAGNARDWGAWDATYDFVKGDNPDYLSDNLATSTMRNLDINVFAVYDAMGKLLSAVQAESFSGAPATLPGVSELLHASPRLNLASGMLASVSGIVRLPNDRLMLVASAPIKPTESGRARPIGSLVLGRLLDEAHLDAVSAETQHAVEIRGIPDAREEGPSRKKVEVWSGGSSVLESTTTLIDLNGDVAAQLVIASDRLARSNALFTLVLLSWGLLVTLFCSALVLRHGIRGIVLDRILSLSAQVDRIRQSGHTERVLVGGDDEIASLGANVDRMLESLEESRAELQRAHDELEARVVERNAELIRAVSELEEEVQGRIAAEDGLAASEARSRLLIDNLTDTVFTLDADGSITYVSPAVEWAFGYLPADLVGKPIAVLLTLPSAKAVARRLERGLAKEGTTLNLDAVTAEGEELSVEMVLSPIDASIGAVQGIIRDVTARRRYEDELLHIASHDFLTGLVNRRRFEEELERVLASAKRHGTEGAVLWIDLDDFKDVNDTLGHHAGDELLVDIARALRASVRAESVLARLGGDEFAVLLPVATRDQAGEAGDRLLAEIAKVHIFFEGRIVRARGSMGIVMFPGDGLEVEELLARADTAMYRAKQLGRARSVFFTRDEEWHDEIERSRAWADQIELAVREDTLSAFAQPIVSLGDGVAHSFELLVRMLDVDGDLIPAASFIGVAERTGLVVEIDLWMLEEAVRILGEFNDQRVRVNINVSPRTLGDERFLTDITRLAAASNLTAERLGLEIVESAVVVDVGRAQDVLGELKRSGHRVLLDGFGSGFTSFLHLQKLPIDTLKIDGSFIQRLGERSDEQHLVRAMVEMARGLGMGTVAECVETGAAIEVLRRLGVESIQGNYVGRPGPARSVIGAELAHSEARSILLAGL